MAAHADVPDVDGIEGLDLIGRGGFATVYRGRQPAFQRDVAVKVLQRSGLDSDDRRRFERECQAMGALSGHPGIVTLYDAGFTADERPYIVMAYAAGGTLADQLRSGPLNWQSVAELGVRLAGALETAHRAGVIHRDIKPANVLRSDFGVQLSDFGIARLQGGHETQTGLITASVAHAAPEILDGDPPSVQADVYSLGSTLYEAAAGKAAFTKTTDEGLIPLIRRVVSDPVPDLRQQGTPMELADVIERAMNKNPAARYGTAEALGHALQGAQTALLVATTDMIVAGPSRATPEPAPKTTPTIVNAPLTTSDAQGTDTAVIPSRTIVADPSDTSHTGDAGGPGALKWIIPTVFVALAALVAGIFLVTRDGDPEQIGVPGGDTVADTVVSESAVPTVVPQSTDVPDTAPANSDPAATGAASSTEVPATTLLTPPVAALEAEVVSDTDIAATTEVNGLAFRAIDAISFDPASGALRAIKEPAPQAVRDVSPALADPVVFAVPFNDDNATADLASGAGMALEGSDGAPYGLELDAEGMAVLDDGSFFVVSEGSGELDNSGRPFVHRFDSGGRFLSELRLPAWYLPNEEETSGFTPRRGPHGIDRRPGAPGEVVLAIEAQLLQDFDPDAPDQRQVARLAAFDESRGTITAEWGYPFDPVAAEVLQGNPAAQSLIVDITTLGDDVLIVLESTPTVDGVVYSLYSVELSEGGRPNPDLPDVVEEKTLIMVFSDAVPAPLGPLASIAAGPVLNDGRRSLLLTSDNLWTDDPTRLLVLALS